jgi:hypothetical protein
MGRIELFLRAMNDGIYRFNTFNESKKFRLEQCTFCSRQVIDDSGNRNLRFWVSKTGAIHICAMHEGFLNFH